MRNDQSTTVVRSLAMPYFLEGDGSGAALVLHGFTGIPNEMRYVAEEINRSGYAVSVPRLPGHGTNGSDFVRTGARDWLRRGVDAYLELKSQFDTVHLVGLSMGGVIATILAARYGTASLSLLAPGIATKNALIPFTPILRYVVPSHRKEDRQERTHPDEIALSQEYWSIQRPGQVAEFRKLQVMSRRLISKVNAPTLIVVSKCDNSIPLSVASFVVKRLRNVPSKVTVLERSGHVVTTGVEKETVARDVVEWITEH